jgi:hypothetical protein
MTERSQDLPPRSGGENEGAEDEGAGTGGEGRRNVEATPPVGQDAVPGQTAVPAPGDDVGVPSDEEIARGEE